MDHFDIPRHVIRHLEIFLMLGIHKTDFSGSGRTTSQVAHNTTAGCDDVLVYRIVSAVNIG